MKTTTIAMVLAVVVSDGSIGAAQSLGDIARSISGESSAAWVMRRP